MKTDRISIIIDVVNTITVISAEISRGNSEITRAKSKNIVPLRNVPSVPIKATIKTFNLK